LKELDDSASRIEKGVKVFREESMTHYLEGLEPIQKKYDDLHEELFKARVALKIAITKKKDNLEIEQEDISRKLNGLRKLILTGVKDMVKPEDVNKKMCPVCFEREVNTVLLPCGHTYCKECADIDRTRYAKCPQCRSNVNSRVKIYFSI
jgi:late competence protein required for DNA uptake (superfamily II DNA/RNA helicase)